MEPPITPSADAAVSDIAAHHGVSRETTLAMLSAVRSGGGRMAQFSIPELGGTGQWMRGGMTMVGSMSDLTLKARVDALCVDLAHLLETSTVFTAAPTPAPTDIGTSGNNWWPNGFGVPSSTGAQNGVRYAIFPSTRRLVVETGGTTRVYDTAEHRIGGVGQQQGGSAGTLGFSSQLGTFDVTGLQELGDAELPVLDAVRVGKHRAGPEASDTPAQRPTPTHAPSVEPPAGRTDAIVAAIEQLAGLHERGILTDEEFAAKKAELLSRL